MIFLEKNITYRPRFVDVVTTLIASPDMTENEAEIA